MGSLKFNGIFMLLLLLCHENVQGFAPVISDYPVVTGTGVNDRIQGLFQHQIISKRDVVTSSDIPKSVQELSILLQNIIQAVQGKIQGEDLEQDMTDVINIAIKIVQESGVVVSEQDMKDVIEEISSVYLPVLDTTTDSDTGKLHLALVLLYKLTEELTTVDPSKVVALVGTIKATAEEIINTLEDLKALFAQMFSTLKVTRETTVGGHAETGPNGHSGGISASHTSGGSTYGGHIEHGPGGTSGGVSASHTWSHGDGSKTTVGGYVDHSHSGGTSGGIEVTHTFGKRSVKRQTTVGGHVDKGPWGTSGGISGSHTVGGTTYGGHVDYGPQGTSSGISATHTWNHGSGSSTTLGGHVDHSSWGGTSGGLSVTHTFGRRRVTELGHLRKLQSRQTTVGGHVDTGPWGTSGGISGSHTIGGTTLGGNIEHGPWGTSGGLSGSYSSGDSTLGGHVNYGPGGTSGGLSGSHTVDGTTYGGHVDYGPSGTSGGLSASHTWNHGDGSSTSLGGFVGHSPVGGTSGGLSLTHNFGK